MADPYKVEEIRHSWYVVRVADGVHIQKFATYAQAQALREQLNDAATLAALALTSDVHYRDVVLDPVALTTAPFYDSAETGPGLIAVPGGPGYSLLPLERYALVGAGVPWNSDMLLKVDYSASALRGYVTLQNNVQTSTDPLSYEWELDAPTLGGIDPVLGSVGEPLVLWTTTALQGGSRPVLVRLYYKFIPAVATLGLPAYYSITSVDQEAKIFVVDDTDAVLDGATGTFEVVGSTGNDGTYTIVSAVAAAGSTTIVVSETIPDSTADGWVKRV